MALNTDGYFRTDYNSGGLKLSVNSLAEEAGRAELLSEKGMIVQAGPGYRTYIAGGYDTSGTGGNVHIVPGEGSGTNHGEVRVYHHNGGEQGLSIALAITNDGVKIEHKAGFNGTTPIAKPTITGSKGSNAALTSLISALAAYGLVTDSTS